MYLKSKDYKLFGPSKMSRFSPAPKVHPLNNNCCEIKWESLEPIEGDPIIYCLQVNTGKKANQVYSCKFSLHHFARHGSTYL